MSMVVVVVVAAVVAVAARHLPPLEPNLRDGGLPLARGAEDLRLRFHPRVRERHPPRHAGQHLSRRSRVGIW